jgi:dihydroorotase
MRWSPFEGTTFPAAITHTFVKRQSYYESGRWNESVKGQRLLFDR